MTDRTDELSEIRAELRSVARRVLDGSDPIRSGRGEPDPLEWAVIADAGWLELEVEERLDGSGAGFAETAVILEEMGRAAASGPFLGTTVLGVGALAAADPGARRDDLLRDVATGRTRLAVTLPAGDRAAGDYVGTPFRLSRDRSGWRVHGKAPFVVDAPCADRILLLATGEDGVPVLVETSGCRDGSAGLSVLPQPVVDTTRRLGTVEAAGAEVPYESVFRFAGDPAAAVRLLHLRAAAAVACDSHGIAAAMLDATVSYTGDRRQFGRPIGSFQAVKHTCADMLVQVSVSEQLVASAVEAVADGQPDAWEAVSMAKSYSGGAAVAVAGKAMQLHGGIGYTWERGVHAYLKRAALNRSLFGSSGAHRRLLAGRYR